MKKIIAGFLALFMTACGAAPVEEAAVSEVGIKTSTPGLIELMQKVSGRDDADCMSPAENVSVCFVSEGREVYSFTFGDHPAHPAALFRGYVEVEGQEALQLQERGWYAGNEAAARAFFERRASSAEQPKRG